MHSKLKWPAVICGVLLFVSSAAAQLVPSRPSQSPTPIIPPVPTPTSPPQPPAANPEQNIPVVITYGDGAQTRAQITRGIMQPVGIPPNQPVTVTLFLGSGIPSTLVRVGLYDGGQIAAAAALPSPPPIGVSPIPLPTPLPIGGVVPVITVETDQTVRFNFQSGRLLGLYRALVTIGPKQYLLQFYAVRPRSTSGLPPLPSPIPAIVPSPPPPPIK